MRKFKIDWQMILFVVSGLSTVLFTWALGHYSLLADKSERYEVSAETYELSKWLLGGLGVSLMCFVIMGKRALAKLQNFLRKLGKKPKKLGRRSKKSRK